MAKLRVGEVEIDGRNVTIHSTKPDSGRLGARRHTPDPGMVRVLRGLPVPVRTLAWLGAFGIAAGIGLVAASLTWEAMAGWLLPAGALMSVGAGSAAVALAKHLIARNPEWEHRAALGPEIDRYLIRLISLLNSENRRQSVPWIVSQTGWPEETVVHALAVLVGRGRVSEIQTPGTGAFYYVTTSAFLAHDLDSRVRNLNP
jgi:hypothetical protein